jgi:NADH-quinone oxidoreductase subunit E
MTDSATAKKSLTEMLPEEAIQEIEVWLAKYPADRRRSAVMASLMIAQKNNKGYLSQELMDAVADYLGIPHVAAYEVATFYTMYNHEPVGEHVINVCNNISCMLRGCDDLIAHLEKRLDIKTGQTTEDNKITLRTVECAGACAGAPMCEIDEVYYEHLTEEKLDKLVDNLLGKQGEA